MIVIAICIPITRVLVVRMYAVIRLNVIVLVSVVGDCDFVIADGGAVAIPTTLHDTLSPTA